MPYIFRGRLCGYICAECPEPLSAVTVRLYRSAEESGRLVSLAVASPKETFAVLSAEQVSEKESRLLAEARTDDDGNFTFELGDKQYNGEAFEVDVYCETVPRRKEPPEPIPPVQFSITTLQPRWRQTREGSLAVWDYCIPYRYWCGVRARFGAWTICGRLTTCDRQAFPIPGATVRAFDADWWQDDPLGSGVTDSDGRFRIDYSWEDFQTTPFSPLINFEWVGGPDVYFTAELGGDVLLDEDRSLARTPGRENVGSCLCVDLCTEKTPKILIANLTLPAEGSCAPTVNVPSCTSGSMPLRGIEIRGTAAGPPFNNYRLRYSYGGSPINTAVVYPNCDRPPANPTHSTPVINGTLGWLDVNQLPPGVTGFTVYLDVFDAGSGSASDTQSFQIQTRAVEITAVATVPARVGIDPFLGGATGIKHIRANAADPHETSVGGAFSITGSAYIIGCDRVLRQFLLTRFNAPPSSAVPTPADATGGTQLLLAPRHPVVYNDTLDHPFQSGCFFSTPNTILNGNLVSEWQTQDCLLGGSVFKVLPTPFWGSGGLNGRFVILLEVSDIAEGTTGPLAVAGVDQVAVWIDNRSPQALITAIGGLGACIDLRLNPFKGTPNVKADINGIAWDPPIDPAAPQTRPNDNFGGYSLSFRKNGGVSTGTIATPSPVVRVPNLAWPGPVSGGQPQPLDPSDPTHVGLLAQWDIVAALDGGDDPVPPGSVQLQRGTRCAYVLTLDVSDTTHVGDSGGGHPAQHTYAINIINDIPLGS